jgi:hypothetical protein
MTDKDSDIPSSENKEIMQSSLQSIPNGFGKGVNDYLNHYVTVSDAKAAAFLALSFIVIQFLLKDHPCVFWGIYSHWVAFGFLFLTVFMAAVVLFPRLPRGSKGLIFWEDVYQHKSPRQYETELAKLQSTGIEREYAHQNFYVSKVLHNKMRFIRWEIIFFLIGSGCTIISILGHSTIFNY